MLSMVRFRGEGGGRKVWKSRGGANSHGLASFLLLPLLYAHTGLASVGKLGEGVHGVGMHSVAVHGVACKTWASIAQVCTMRACKA